MNNIYDTIIVGAGPAGLTFATLADENEKILIIDKDNVIGGCHKVNRQIFENEKYFCEHGPRIYFNNYLNFRQILKKMNLDFYKIFKPYNLSLPEIFFKEISYFNFNEMLILTRDYFRLLFDPTYGINMSMYEYLTNNKFSNKAIDYVDRRCRMIDGGDNKKISFHTFFNIINECMLYKIYQPSKPNDEGLFKYWYNYLKNRKINFKLNTGIDKIIEDESIIKIKSYNNEIFQTKKLILALPPSNLINILEDSPENIKNSFGNFDILKKYASNTEYAEYISITFHWGFKIDIDSKIYGMHTNTDWGIGAIVLTDYIKFKERNSKTVISCSITITDKKSKNINKTANECTDKKEIFDEVYSQLKEIYVNLPYPTLLFINNRYVNGKWISSEEAFIKTPDNGYLNFSNNKNIYTLGTHNGKGVVHFTSLESAVTNAIELSNLIYNTNYNVKKPYNMKELIIIIFVLFFIAILFIIKYYI